MQITKDIEDYIKKFAESGRDHQKDLFSSSQPPLSMSLLPQVLKAQTPQRQDNDC